MMSISIQRYTKDIGYLDFGEYVVVGEPHKREQAEAWKVAIGLQAVNRLLDYRRRITEGS